MGLIRKIKDKVHEKRVEKIRKKVEAEEDWKNNAKAGERAMKLFKFGKKHKNKFVKIGKFAKNFYRVS